MQGNPHTQNRGPLHSSKHKRKRSSKHKQKHDTPTASLNDELDGMHVSNSRPGQIFHMDLGFVRGSNYILMQEEGPTITSKDGFNSYFIIVDRATCYT